MSYRPKPSVSRRNVRISYKRRPRMVHVDQRRTPVVKPLYQKPIHIRETPPTKRNVVKSVVSNKQKIVTTRKSHGVPKRHNLIGSSVSYNQYKEKILSLRGIGRGRILVMLAPGPSILEAPIEQLKEAPNVDLMTINKPDPRVWPTRFWSFCDHTQYSRNQTTWDQYTGIILNSGGVRVKKHNQIIVRNKSGKGFSHDLVGGYYIGRSTTYASLQLALWMNYNAIYVMGCDMGKVTIHKGDKDIEMLHSYGTNPDVPEEKRLKRFAMEAEYYKYAAEHLKDKDRERIFFCSAYNKWGFVDRFNRLDHREAIGIILEKAQQLRQT